MHLSNRQEVLRLLGSLPTALVATISEVMTGIESHRLCGLVPQGQAGSWRPKPQAERVVQAEQVLRVLAHIVHGAR